MRRAIFLVALVCLAAPSAALADPCWQRVISDYYDNARVDRTYDPACYRAAIRKLHEADDGNVEIWGIREDLEREKRLAASKQPIAVAEEERSTLPAIIVTVAAAAFLGLSMLRLVVARKR